MKIRLRPEITQVFNNAGKKSQFLVICLFAVFAYILAPADIFASLYTFLSGDFLALLSTEQVPASTILGAALVCILCVLPLVVFIAFVLKRLMGKYTISSELTSVNNPRYLLRQVLIFNIIEEILARWLLMGGLPLLLGIHTNVGYGILLFVGNLLWTDFHIYNIQEKEKRQTIRMLPIFIIGIMLSFVFLKYGILASILTHLIYNAVVAARYKREDVSPSRWQDVALYTGLAGICFQFMQQSPVALYEWLSQSTKTLFTDWQFADFFWANLFLQILTIGILQSFFHLESQRPKKKNVTELGIDLFASLLGWPIFMVVHWGTTFITGDIYFQGVMVCLVLGAITKQHAPNQNTLIMLWALIAGSFFVHSLVLLPWYHGLLLIFLMQLLSMLTNLIREHVFGIVPIYEDEPPPKPDIVIEQKPWSELFENLKM